jgi:hypothetical protein
VCGLAWSVANKTDGYLSDEDLALIPGVNLEAAEALYDAELWWGHMHGAQIIVFEETQTSRADMEVLANARRRQRDKMRRRRGGTVPRHVPGHSSGNSTRTGQARPGAKTEGQAPPWLPAEFSENSPDVRGAEGDAAGGDLDLDLDRSIKQASKQRDGAAPSQSLRDHDGPDSRGSDVQHFSNRGTSRGQPADRNAREACPVCGMKQRLRTNGKLARHGPKFTPLPRIRSGARRGPGMTAASRTTYFYAGRMPERELQQLVGDLCRLLGLPHFHVRHSRGMTAGWPDSVIIGTKVIYRELKSEHGQLSPDQCTIGGKLKAAGADWKVWRPRDWLDGTIERELRLLKGQPMLPLTG